MTDSEIDQKLDSLKQRFDINDNELILFKGEYLSWKEYHKKQIPLLVGGIAGLDVEGYLDALEVDLIEKYADKLKDYT